jgi:hypothetical protein
MSGAVELPNISFTLQVQRGRWEWDVTNHSIESGPAAAVLTARRRGRLEAWEIEDDTCLGKSEGHGDRA